MNKWKYFKHEIKMHQGTHVCILMILIAYYNALQDKDIFIGLIMATVFTILLCIMWITTSIDVGKANWEDEDEQTNS